MNKEAKKQVQKLFVGGIPFSVDNKLLKQEFSKFGSIKKALVIKCPRSRKSKGYGFVIFDEIESLEKALDNDVVIAGKLVDCHTAENKSTLKSANQSLMRRKIFVGGLPQDLNREQLAEYFSKFGSVQESRILYDGKNGKSRGFGFITFEDEDDVMSVLQIKSHIINEKDCECKLFDPTEISKSTDQQDESSTDLELLEDHLVDPDDNSPIKSVEAKYCLAEGKFDSEQNENPRESFSLMAFMNASTSFLGFNFFNSSTRKDILKNLPLNEDAKEAERPSNLKERSETAGTKFNVSEDRLSGHVKAYDQYCPTFFYNGAMHQSVTENRLDPPHNETELEPENHIKRALMRNLDAFYRLF